MLPCNLKIVLGEDRLGVKMLKSERLTWGKPPFQNGIVP